MLQFSFASAQFWFLLFCIRRESVGCREQFAFRSKLWFLVPNLFFSKILVPNLFCVDANL
jgi:hypothetical protein